MATMSPRPATKRDKKETQPAASRSSPRLSASARRDVRWALQQVPGEGVRDITMHGVKISFHTGINQVQAKGTVPHGRGENGQDSQRPEPAEKPLNSAQRRSRARAKKHYAALKKASDAMAPDNPASAQPAGPEPLA